MEEGRIRGIGGDVARLIGHRIGHNFIIPTQDREAHAAFKRMNLKEAEKPIAILPALDINYSYFGL